MKINTQMPASKPSFKAKNLVAVVHADEKNIARALLRGFDMAASFEMTQRENGVVHTFVHSLYRKETGATEFYVLSDEHAKPILALDVSIQRLKELFRADMSSDLFRNQLDLAIGMVDKLKKDLATFAITEKMPKP